MHHYYTVRNAAHVIIQLIQQIESEMISDHGLGHRHAETQPPVQELTLQWCPQENPATIDQTVYEYNS